MHKNESMFSSFFLTGSSLRLLWKSVGLKMRFGRREQLFFYALDYLNFLHNIRKMFNTWYDRDNHDVLRTLNFNGANPAELVAFGLMEVTVLFFVFVFSCNTSHTLQRHFSSDDRVTSNSALHDPTTYGLYG